MSQAALDVQDQFSVIEDEFNSALDDSLDPRGPEFLYELVENFGLPAGARVLDVGSGTGRHSIELARRFHFAVVGVEPVERLRTEASTAARSLRLEGVSFEPGSAEAMTGIPDGSIDLVWCRDVLSMVEDLDAVYVQFRRVLRPGGRALVYQGFAGPNISPAEAAWLFPVMACVPASMDVARTEAAIAASGLRIVARHELGSEWAEFAQEQSGKPGRKLLHAARLLRQPETYIDRFGQQNYDIALGDALWQVYRMLGKLTERVYELVRD